MARGLDQGASSVARGLDEGASTTPRLSQLEILMYYTLFAHMDVVASGVSNNSPLHSKDLIPPEHGLQLPQTRWRAPRGGGT